MYQGLEEANMDRWSLMEFENSKDIKDEEKQDMKSRSFMSVAKKVEREGKR